MKVHVGIAIGGLCILIMALSASNIRSSLLSGYETCDQLVSATKANSNVPIHLLMGMNIFCTSEQREYLQKYKANN